MNILKALIFSLISLFSLFAFSGGEDRPTIFSEIMSREILNPDGTTTPQKSETYEMMSSGDDCSEHDVDNIYANYELNTVVLSPSRKNAAAFTKSFNGNESVQGDIISVIHQTCYGIGLREDVISTND